MAHQDSPPSPLQPIQAVIIGQNRKEASFADALLPPWNERVIGYSNIGQGRQKNQDAASFLLFGENPLHAVLSVADGLGSSFFSEQAALLAVTQIPKDIGEGEELTDSFLKVHRKLVDQQLHSLETQGTVSPQANPKPIVANMGTTTLVMAEIRENNLIFSNVGDSRGYLIRNGKIVFQTKDQSMTQLLLDSGELSHPLQTRRHPLRNVILNALGSPEPFYRGYEGNRIVMKPSGLPAVDQLTLEKNDLILLATDGFFTNLDEEELVDIIQEGTTSQTPWHSLEGVLSSKLQHTLATGETSLGETANADNFTFVIYRHD